MVDQRYRRDIERNIYVSPLRKKRWLFYFLRKEQAASLSVLKKLCALGKKMALAGTGCAFSHQVTLGANGRSLGSGPPWETGCRLGLGRR